MEYSDWLKYNEVSNQCSMCGTPINESELYCSGTCFEADLR